jgi:pimeloyl-ACP methyl ester carboxylesterase
MTNPSNAKRPIVLIHGLWLTPLSWEKWIARYRARGHEVMAPSWPHMDGDVAALRRDPAPYAELTVREIVDHYDQIVSGMHEPPILMGHSFGGLFVQMLLDRGLGAAGVAIDSAPMRGVLSLPWSTLRSSWPVLRRPANRHRAVALTPDEFHYAFTNTLDADASKKVYERYAVPGPGGVLFEGALANINPRTTVRVDFHNDARSPLLLIAGGADHTVPRSLSRENARRYKKSKAVTDYKEFAGRSHYTLGQDGWEEVADYAIDWATQHEQAHAAA